MHDTTRHEWVKTYEVIEWRVDYSGAGELGNVLDATHNNSDLPLWV
jgi:hypothetical protein